MYIFQVYPTKHPTVINLYCIFQAGQTKHPTVINLYFKFTQQSIQLSSTCIYISSLPNHEPNCHQPLYIYFKFTQPSIQLSSTFIYTFQVYPTKHLTVINLYIYIFQVYPTKHLTFINPYIYISSLPNHGMLRITKSCPKNISIFVKFRRKFFILFLVDFTVSINFIYSIFLRRINLKSLIKLFYHDIFQNFSS